MVTNVINKENKLSKVSKMKKMVTASAMVTVLGAGLVFGGDAEASEHTYTVKSGDTLNKISQQYNVSVNDIASINGIKNINFISVGQTLKLGQETKQETSNDNVRVDVVDNGVYKVKSGDSLYKIANAHGISVSNLQSWNNLSGTLIFPGQELVVEGSVAKPQPQPTVSEPTPTPPPKVVEYDEPSTPAPVEEVKEVEKQGSSARTVNVSKPAPKQNTQPTQSSNSPNWGALAQCESSGNASVVSANGLYHGLYQFDVQTWKSVGGSGLPSEASPAEQTKRAQMLYDQRGSQPWPVCGANL